MLAGGGIKGERRKRELGSILGMDEQKEGVQSVNVKQEAVADEDARGAGEGKHARTETEAMVFGRAMRRYNTN